MIKQRFIIDDCGTLIDVVTRKHYDYVSDVVDVLNDLDSENTHLKYSLGAYMVDLNNYKGKCSALEQENEQLKQFQDRVFSWIDMHLQRLPTLIDDEFNSDNEFADPSLYSGALQILETMKKELKGDVE